MNIQIDYTPRPLQKVIHALCRQHRFVVLVCHRRFGKTVLAVNELQRSALLTQKPNPHAALIGPSYRQEKDAAWDYMRHFAREIPDVDINQSELRITYPNKGQTRIYGANNQDSLRGTYYDHVALDEYGLHPPSAFSEVIFPALSDRGGRALFLGTPNGKNQFYDKAQEAKREQARGNPDWCFAEFKASDTGIILPGEIAVAKSQMTADEFAQEYECSFEAAVKGAIYSREMERAREEKRITQVPYDPLLPVDTDWDLGIGDAMAIWFSQSTRSGEVRLIDYYESSGEGFPFYAKLLAQKPYAYGRHWAPHDIAVRELGTGKSRLDVARASGIKFEVTPRIHTKVGEEVEEGIHAARMIFPRCWFDAEKCREGLEALVHYRRDYNQRLNEFKASPVHDWASHGADAFRGLAVRHQTPTEKRKPALPQLPMEWAWT